MSISQVRISPCVMPGGGYPLGSRESGAGDRFLGVGIVSGALRSSLRRLCLIAAAVAALVVAIGAPAAVADPVVMAAGDIACGSPGSTTPGLCSQAYTANLLLAQQRSAEGLAAVLPLGDNQYPSGALSDFQTYFDPTWGQLRSIMHPVVGNHEYDIPGASGYFDYFAGVGVGAGNRGEGWYSFDLGSWHLIALNSSNGCSPVSCATGSPQETWLKSDLASTNKQCLLVYWHHPLSYAPAEHDIWQDLYGAGADLVLVGHHHAYVPPVAHDASGAPDPAGPREVVVGTGGSDGGVYGVLKVTLHAGSFDWRFVGSGASDSGSASCHRPPPPPPPPPPARPTASFTATTSGLTASLTDTSTGAPTSWSWSFGDGSISTAQSPSHTYARAGTFTVTLTAANPGGRDTATRDVTVVAPPPSPPASGLVALPGVAATAALRLSLPAPTGPFPVGVRSAFVTDRVRIDPATHRPRALPVRVWYPARSRATAGPALYLSPAIEQVAERTLGLPAGSLDIATHASERAPARSRVRGVILVSPGAGMLAALNTALMVDLASRGYAVVAIDHPHDSAAVEQPGGAVVAADAALDSHIASAFDQRVRDVGVVLGQLSRLVPQRRPATRVAILGHSLGGSVAAEAMRRYARLRAGIDLDGSPRGSVVAKGLSRPFALMLEPRARALPGFARFIARLRGPHPIMTLAVEVYGFTDLALFNPAAALADPALGARLEQALPSGTVADLAAGGRAVDRQRRFLAGFMGRYVAGP
jgi:PKD repeat protein